MARHLIRKLEQFTKLSVGDQEMLEHAASQRVRHLGGREDIIHEGDRPSHVNLILEGFACRYKTLEDGRRQILGFLIPGDLCDAHVFLVEQTDHSIGTLSPAKLAEIPAQTFLDLTERSARLARAFTWNSLVELAIAREWTLNVGQRTAYERMAHILCEFYLRLHAVGLTQGQSCDFPMTQAELADALGLSTVHTNRVLQDLRADGLIKLQGKTLAVPNLAALKNAALFDPCYLHLDYAKQRFHGDRE